MTSRKLQLVFAKIRQPRIVPILLAVLTFFIFYVYSQHLVVQPRYIYTQDDEGFIQHVVNNLFEADKLAVITLGGSSMREAILPKEVIESSLKERLSKEVQFWNLGSGSQSLSESLALFSSLDLKPGSIVVLQLSINRLHNGILESSKQFEKPRLPFLDYSDLGAFLKHLNYETTPSYVWQKNNLWIAKILSDIAKQKQENSKIDIVGKVSFYLHCIYDFLHVEMKDTYYQYFYKYKDYKKRDELLVPMTDEKKEYYLSINERSRMFSNYKKNRMFNLNMIHYFADLTQSKNVKLILLILPQDPIADRIENHLKEQLHGDLHAFEKRGVVVVDYSTLKDFQSADFYDWYHFIQIGRERFTPIFINMLAKEMESA